FIDNETPMPKIPLVGLWHQQHNSHLNLVGVEHRLQYSSVTKYQPQNSTCGILVSRLLNSVPRSLHMNINVYIE
ncbi:hypothetical protein AB6C40_05620, partial [Vibrio splendidus]